MESVIGEMATMYPSYTVQSDMTNTEKVAVDLRSFAFTHGQLYVAISRATSASGMAILLSENVAQTEIWSTLKPYTQMLLHSYFFTIS